MHVLIIEDSPGDQRILKEAFKRVDSKVDLTLVESADMASLVLKNGKPSQDKPKPNLIILDLNLPRKSGKEFLKELKTHKHSKRIPVLVLTSSQAEADVNDCYDLGASCYLKKPMKFQDFLEMVDALCKFWTQEVIYSP